MLIRNILLAFTTSCVSIFDISNDILYTSSFSHHSFTSSTANNADFRFIQILHVPLYFIEQKFSHEQIQHGLLFTKNTPTFVLKAGVFLRLYQFLVRLFHHYFTVKQFFEPLCLLSIGNHRRSDTTAFVRTIPETFKGLGFSQQFAFCPQKVMLVQMK